MPYRDYPPVTGEDDPGFANQGYDKAARVQHLKAAHAHAQAAARCLQRAIDILDAGDEMPSSGDDDIDPAIFDDPEVGDNPEGEARRAALFILRSLS